MESTFTTTEYIVGYPWSVRSLGPSPSLFCYGILGMIAPHMLTLWELLLRGAGGSISSVFIVYYVGGALWIGQVIFIDKH